MTGFTIGDKVAGNYMGIPFAGVVSAVHPHTINHDVALFDVDLDEPIEVFGTQRVHVHFGAHYDGIAAAAHGWSQGDLHHADSVAS